MDKVKIDFVDRISETSLLTLAARAKESQSPEPIIIDHKACEILNHIDYDFANFNNKLSQVVISMRADYFDKKVSEFIIHSRHPVVINVGCGLDTRFNRIGDIVTRAVFYHIDLPDVIEIRKRLIPAEHNDNYIADSILNTTWMDKVKRENPDGEFILIIEGVFIYLKKEMCFNFLQEISQIFHNGRVLFDVFNFTGLVCNSINNTLKNTDAKFLSSFNKVDELTFCGANIMLEEEKNFKDLPGARRMGKGPFLLMHLFPNFRNFYRLLIYRIKSQDE